MARTIDEIMAEMIAAKESKPELVALNSTSTTAIWRAFMYIVAFAHNLLERIFDTHKSEVNELLSTLKPHTSRWYEAKAKAFQYGFNLLPNDDEYDNTGATAEQIQASKIIAMASSVETIDGVVIKVAKLSGVDLVSLSQTELAAFQTYMLKVKDAGVRVISSSDDAEKLKVELTVYYNPLVLNGDGSRIDDTDDNPVETAIKSYLSSINFNGTFKTASMVDVLQSTEGIDIPTVDYVAFKYGTLSYIEFEVFRRPNSGYMILQELEVTYLPNINIQ
ncbi:MAG: hypothetical protein PHW82_08940 [Bacteroidales bacterium]|nr:hypothetical protein [Bacteroidales bacterium]